MKTEDLINQLGDTAQPVKPLRSPLMRALIWLFVLGVVMIIGIVASGLRADFAEMIMHPLFALELGGLLVAGICATIATFHLSIPDEKIHPFTWALLGIAGSILLIRMSICGIMADPEMFLYYFKEMVGLPIIAKGLAMSVIPAVLLFSLIKKGAPVRGSMTFVSGTLAIASFAAIGCRSICPLNDPAYIFVWHNIPLVILILIGLLVGRRALRW